MSSQWMNTPALSPIMRPFQSDDHDTSDCVEHLNAMLRGQISAGEMCRMAIDKLMMDGRHPGQVAMLRELQRDHHRAMQMLQSRVAALGMLADHTSGAWGTWAKIAMSTAQIFGDSAAVRALRDGEEHLLREMRSAMDSLDSKSIELVEHDLIPMQEHAIKRLGSLAGLINA